MKDYGQHSRSDRLESGGMNRERREVAQARRALGNKTLCPSETTPLYERKKAMRAFCGRLFGRGKGVKRPFGCYDGLRDVRKTSAGFAMVKVNPERPPLALLWPKWSQIDLRWLRYDQSGPRLTSAGFAMTKVVPDWPLLASLWPKWSQIDLCWLRYDQSGPRLTSSGITMIKVVRESVEPDLVRIPLKWNQRYRDGAYLFAASVWLFPTFRPNACLSGKVALASGRLALLSACVSACSSWWAEQMECHAAVVCVSLRLIEQVLRSLWWVVEDEKRVSISPTLWERFRLLFW